MASSPDAFSPRLQQERWRRRARHAAIGLVATVVFAFLAPIAAPAFDDIRVLGMRFGVFMAAEGVVLLIVLLVLWSNRVQSRIEEPEDRSPSGPA